jgi:hypothetical protein
MTIKYQPQPATLAICGSGDGRNQGAFQKQWPLFRQDLLMMYSRDGYGELSIGQGKGY